MAVTKFLSFDLAEPLLAAQNPDNGEGNHRKIEQAKRIVRLIIEEQLTKRQKTVMELYYYQERTMAEIAQILGIHKSTVSRTLARAMRNIENILKYYEIR